MKRSQMVVALVVLAAMVFGVTFAMNYLGGWFGADSSRTPTQEARGLTFSVTQATGPGEFLDGETKGQGYHDFWFLNENEGELPLGLNRVRCRRCSSVEAYVLKPAGVQALLAFTAALPGCVPQGPLPGGLPQAALAAAA